jgi:CheY-like chemotaxis protein
MPPDVAVVTKPVRGSRLFETLSSVLGATAAAAAADAVDGLASLPAGTPGVRVLVVEDNPVNQKVATMILDKLGYRSDVVADGAEAVEALRRVSYAAVLMDCQMPNMDGYEATAVIRRDEAGRGHVPIIAMTASAMEGDRERCLTAGMDDYVAKPVRPAEVAAALQRWTTAPADAHAGEGSPAPA